jgi:hypothetical protein
MKLRAASLRMTFFVDPFAGSKRTDNDNGAMVASKRFG